MTQFLEQKAPSIGKLSKALLEEGNYLILEGKIFDALEKYNSIFEFDKYNMEAHYSLVETNFAISKIYFENNMLKEALRYIDSAIAGDVKKEYFLFRASIFEKLGNQSQADLDRECVRNNDCSFQEKYLDIRIHIQSIIGEALNDIKAAILPFYQNNPEEGSNIYICGRYLEIDNECMGSLGGDIKSELDFPDHASI